MDVQDDYIGFCSVLVEQLQGVKQETPEWKKFRLFLEMVGPKMAEASEKLMYS